jgi:hypothetical protein
LRIQALAPYRPIELKFLAMGGQSSLFTFVSEALDDREFVVKVYDSRFSKQAEQEYKNMHMLSIIASNVLRVYSIGSLRIVEEEEEDQS